jgi:hypothetical protein
LPGLCWTSTTTYSPTTCWEQTGRTSWQDLKTVDDFYLCRDRCNAVCVCGRAGSPHCGQWPHLQAAAGPAGLMPMTPNQRTQQEQAGCRGLTGGATHLTRSVGAGAPRGSPSRVARGTPCRRSGASETTTRRRQGQGPGASACRLGWLCCRGATSHCRSGSSARAPAGSRRPQ